ncbi:MAG: ECF-type sigma factor [Acidobacteriota bacterium]
MIDGKRPITTDPAPSSAGGWELTHDAVPALFDELRRVAASYLRRERVGHTLQATALVHEAYIRLRDGTTMRFRNRAHCVGTIAHMMRRILVEHARVRNAQKRGGAHQRVTLAEATLTSSQPADLEALDDAMQSLGRKDPLMVRVVELRYFGGLTLEETAEVLGVSRATVVLIWRRTKVWLHRELESTFGG